MPLRFRRTMKVAPGMRLNLTKTGVSARIGTRGVGITTGTSGTTVSAGLPGSGVHVSKKLKKNAAQSHVAASNTGSEPKTKGMGFLGWLSILVIMLCIIWIIF